MNSQARILLNGDVSSPQWNRTYNNFQRMYGRRNLQRLVGRAPQSPAVSLSNIKRVLEEALNRKKEYIKNILTTKNATRHSANKTNLRIALNLKNAVNKTNAEVRRIINTGNSSSDNFERASSAQERAYLAYENYIDNYLVPYIRGTRRPTYNVHNELYKNAMLKAINNLAKKRSKALLPLLRY